MSQSRLATSVLARSRRLLGLAATVAQKEVGQRIREQLTASAEKLQASELATRIAQARAIAQSLGELKGAAMKAGQLLSIESSDLLPPEALEILSKLQGQVAPVDFAVIEEVLMAELGAEQLSLLTGLEHQAAAAASIGQVHKAWVQGEPVAVKIQYPGVAESIDSDMALLEKLATGLSVVARSKIVLSGVFEELRQVLHREADYEQERQNLVEYAGYLADDPRFVVPRTIEGLCTRRVLTMTWEEGDTLREWMNKNPPLAQREWFAEAMLELYCREFFEWGFVQTDPNPGNFLVRPLDRQIVLLDLGAAVRYDSAFRDGYRELLRTVESKDPDAIVEGCIDLGLLDAREPDATRRCLVDLMYGAIAPFEPAVQPYDFSNAGYAKQQQAVVQRFLRSLVYSPPPRPLIFLHRKLGGIYNVLRRLGVRVDLHDYFRKIVDAPREPSQPARLSA